MRRPTILLLILSCFATVSYAQTAATAPAKAQPQGVSDVLAYIERGWTVLRRDLDNCDMVRDKHPELHRESIIYLPKNMPVPPKVQELATKCGAKVEHLPFVITRPGQEGTAAIRPGLLYLPNPYVVPGGFLNEMYGWDSYFIIVGLVKANKLDIAKGMVENFFFEIENYGAILNANRTYFLTRSQPPFLSSMVLEVYDAQKKAGKDDREWLQKAYSYIQRDHEMWVTGPHLAGNTGLSRYHDLGEGPVPEIAEGHDPYYRDVVTWFTSHPGQGKEYIEAHKAGAELKPTPTSPVFAVSVCETDADDPSKPHCNDFNQLKFTDDYYVGDRSMRESGFDISFRFGPFSGSTHHYAAVCLNSLLYKAEVDMERIAGILGKPEDAAKWRAAAAKRKQLMNQYLWDAKAGYFFDYDTEKNTRSTYKYTSTFYPLWAGMATPEQARAVERNLTTFERPGGVAMSPYETGVQWDLPYGWAPINMIAIDGLRKNGFTADVNRLSVAWLSTITENFRRDGTIREKYDVVNKSAEASNFTAGYRENVVGFGWTNASFLQLLSELPEAEKAKIGQSPVTGH